MENEVEIPLPLFWERVQPKDDQITEAVRILSDAKRPVLWVGTGATISGAGPEVESLARRLGAIIVPTTLGRGILSSDHPSVVTAEGAFHTAVSEVIAEADVVLAIGTMFKQEDTANWTATLGTTLIHIDIDPAEIGRSYETYLGIIADAKAALAAILRQLSEKNSASSEWTTRGKMAESERLNKRKARFPTEMRALDILRAAVPRNGILVCDRCNLGYWAYCCLPAYEPRTFQYPMGYGALGGALPQSFGAKLACPDKVVVSVIGDGGIQFTATELAVAVQENIPVTIVVCNNGAYGAIRANQDRNFEGRRFGCDLVNPDFQTFSAAYGIPSTQAHTLEEFETALREDIASEALNMVELRVELSDP